MPLRYSALRKDKLGLSGIDSWPLSAWNTLVGAPLVKTLLKQYGVSLLNRSNEDALIELVCAMYDVAPTKPKEKGGRRRKPVGTLSDANLGRVIQFCRVQALMQSKQWRLVTALREVKGRISENNYHEGRKLFLKHFPHPNSPEGWKVILDFTDISAQRR